MLSVLCLCEGRVEPKVDVDYAVLCSFAYFLYLQRQLDSALSTGRTLR